MNNLIVVDMQREYNSCIPHWLWNETVNAVRKAKNILWYYVDFDIAHTGCNDYSEEYADLIDRLNYLGLSEYQLNKIEFVPKTYGFLRNKMDIGIDIVDIVSTLNLMKKLNVNDSQDIADKYGLVDSATKRMITALHNRNVLTEGEDEAIHVPDFNVDTLFNYRYATMIGGGRDECLAEISIYMKHLGIAHRVDEQLTY